MTPSSPRVASIFLPRTFQALLPLSSESNRLLSSELMLSSSALPGTLLLYFLTLVDQGMLSPLTAFFSLRRALANQLETCVLVIWESRARISFSSLEGYGLSRFLHSHCFKGLVMFCIVCRFCRIFS